MGGEKKGKLKIIENISDLDKIDLSSDIVVVIKSFLDYELYKKINKLGLKGIICGGIDYESLTKILG